MKKEKKRYKWLSQCEAVCQFSNICIGKNVCKPNMKYERVEIAEESDNVKESGKESKE